MNLQAPFRPLPVSTETTEYEVVLRKSEHYEATVRVKVPSDDASPVMTARLKATAMAELPWTMIGFDSAYTHSAKKVKP